MARTVDPARHEARRSAILAAAAQAFAEHGYDGATTAAICRRAGVGSGTLFHYFPDKRTIFVAIVADDLAACMVGLEQIDHTDPVAAVDQVLDLLAADLGDPVAPGLAVAMMQLAHRDPEFATTLIARDTAARTALASMIAEGQGAGAFAVDLDADRAARWIVAIVDGGYLSSDEPGFDGPVERTELRRVVSSYLGGPGRPRS